MTVSDIKTDKTNDSKDLQKAGEHLTEKINNKKRKLTTNKNSSEDQSSKDESSWDKSSDEVSSMDERIKDKSRKNVANEQEGKITQTSIENCDNKNAPGP